MLPKMDGFDVCSELRRAACTTPIILLTARAQEAEKELGLDSGADDYVTKPFSLRELRARIRAQLRRRARADDAHLPLRRLRSGLRPRASCGAPARRSTSRRRSCGCSTCSSAIAAACSAAIS